MYLLFILIILASILVLLKKLNCQVTCKPLSNKKLILDNFDNFRNENTYESDYLIRNIENKKKKGFNSLEFQDYSINEDCLWKNKCELPENNINFFKYNDKIENGKFLSEKIDINPVKDKSNLIIIKKNKINDDSEHSYLMVLSKCLETKPRCQRSCPSLAR